MTDTNPDYTTDLHSILVQSLHLENKCGKYMLGSTPISEDVITHLFSLTSGIKSYGNQPIPYETQRRPPISHSVFLRLHKYLEGHELMPSLEVLTLDIACATSEYIQELEFTFPLFLGPSLQYLDIDGIQKQSLNVIVEMLALLPHEAPQIRNLKLRGADESNLPSDSLDSWIDKMGCLEHIELNEIVSITNSRILKMIGELPNLTRFVLRDSTHDYNQYEYDDSFKGFMKLEQLHVSGSVELVSALIHQLGTTQLKNCECFLAFDDAYFETVASEKETEFWTPSVEDDCIQRITIFPAMFLYHLHVVMMHELADYVPRNWPSLRLNTQTVIGRASDAIPDTFFMQFLDI